MAKKKVAKKKATKKKVAKKATRRSASKRSSKKSAGGEMLLVGSKTKEALKAHGLNVAGDAIEGLNSWVHWLIGQAAARATANGRKTVRAHDFMA